MTRLMRVTRVTQASRASAGNAGNAGSKDGVDVVLIENKEVIVEGSKIPNSSGDRRARKEASRAA